MCPHCNVLIKQAHTHARAHTDIQHAADCIWFQLKGAVSSCSFFFPEPCDGEHLSQWFSPLKSFGNWEMQRGWSVRMELIKNAGEHQQTLSSKQAHARSLPACVALKCSFKHIGPCSSLGCWELASIRPSVRPSVRSVRVVALSTYKKLQHRQRSLC